MNLLLGKQGLLSVMSPSTLVFCFLRLRDQTKTPTALTGGPFSYSEVDTLCLISIASFIDPPAKVFLVIEGKGGGFSCCCHMHMNMYKKW